MGVNYPIRRAQPWYVYDSADNYGYSIVSSTNTQIHIEYNVCPSAQMSTYNFHQLRLMDFYLLNP